jgi:hypothetical protein
MKINKTYVTNIIWTIIYLLFIWFVIEVIKEIGIIHTILAGCLAPIVSKYIEKLHNWVFNEKKGE